MSVEKFKNAGIEIPYVIIPNQTIQDKTLSWAARGLLAFMLSMPTDWVFHSDWLYEQSPNCRRDKLKKLIKELKDAGYLERVQNKNEHGEFTHADTVVHPVKTGCSSVDGFSVDGNTVDGKTAPTNKTDLQSKQNTKISSSTDEHFVDTFFSKVWKVWPKKQNRKRAEKSWCNLLKGKSEQHVQDFTEKLIENINTRVASNEFGFSSMLFSSYLNGKRWEDELAEQEQPTEKQPMWQITLDKIKAGDYKALNEIPYGYQKMVNDARKDGFINDNDWAIVQQFAKEKRYA